MSVQMEVCISVHMYVYMSVRMSVYVHMASMQVQELSQSGDFFWNNTQVKVWQGRVEGLSTTFLEPCNGMFWVGCVYGRNDDANRFNFFCNAALEYLRHHAGGSRCAVNAGFTLSVTLCMHVVQMSCMHVVHACCAWCCARCHACMLCMLVVHVAWPCLYLNVGFSTLHHAQCQCQDAVSMPGCIITLRFSLLEQQIWPGTYLVWALARASMICFTNAKLTCSSSIKPTTICTAERSLALINDDRQHTLNAQHSFHERACSPRMAISTKKAGTPATVTINCYSVSGIQQFGRCCQMTAVVCRPDIIHCHDWPTAPVCYGDKGPSKSVFTIHNLNFGADLIGRAMQAAQVP